MIKDTRTVTCLAVAAFKAEATKCIIADVVMPFSVINIDITVCQELTQRSKVTRSACHTLWNVSLIQQNAVIRFRIKQSNVEVKACCQVTERAVYYVTCLFCLFLHGACLVDATEQSCASKYHCLVQWYFRADFCFTFHSFCWK